jgi:ABC-type transporter Mla subunit MlaD
MGRPSKLTPEQWAQVDRRILDGEPVRVLAREFGISEASIRERIAKSGKIANVQEVARKIVDAEQSLAALPISAQVSAQNLAARLRAISDNLASAAHYGAQTAHRLNALANSEVQKVDDAQPLASVENLKGVAALTKLANESASIALTLLAANKETVTKLNEEKPERKKLDASKVSSKALEELLIARDSA